MPWTNLFNILAPYKKTISNKVNTLSSSANYDPPQIRKDGNRVSLRGVIEYTIDGVVADFQQRAA